MRGTECFLFVIIFLLIHTSSVREKGEKQDQEENDDKENEEEDDERDRMLSALKTAVGFLAVPLLIMFIFGGFGSGSSGGGGGGGEDHSTSAMSRARPPPGQPTAEIKWADFYQNLLLKGEVQEIIIHAGVN